MFLEIMLNKPRGKGKRFCWLQSATAGPRHDFCCDDGLRLKLTTCSTTTEDDDTR